MPSSDQPPPSGAIDRSGPERDAHMGEEAEQAVYEDDEGLDPCEVLRRLDAMGDTLQAMIADAKKALALPSPIVVDTEGWEDELPASGMKTRRRRVMSVMAP